MFNFKSSSSDHQKNKTNKRHPTQVTVPWNAIYKTKTELLNGPQKSCSLVPMTHT